MDSHPRSVGSSGEDAGMNELKMEEDHLRLENFPYSLFKPRIITDDEIEIEEEEEDDERIIEALEHLADIAANELKNAPVRKKRGGRRKKGDFDKIIDGLKLRTEKCGFTNEELNLIWKVVSHPNVNLNCTQRRKVILMMVPKIKVSDEVIKTIIFWLDGAQRKGFKPTVIVGVYQLLNLYAEYMLVEDNGIMNETVITRILLSKSENFVIPWKMRLFRNIATPNLLSLIHIMELNKLQKLKGAKKTHLDDIHAAIGVCKFMRVDLFSNAEPFPWKIRSLNLPADSSRLFYERRLKINQATAKSLHPMADKIFPEFLPDKFRTGKHFGKNILEKMLEQLETERGALRIALSPTLLEVFQQWLRPVLYYRCDEFCGFTTDDDQARYCFIFERCTTITKINQKCLPVLSDWISKRLAIWDFTLFQKFVFELIPYLLPQDVLARKHSLRKSFVRNFTYFPSLRSKLWNALEGMYDNWIKDPDSSSGALQWLFDVLEHCVTTLVYAVELTEATNPVFLLPRICLFYAKIHMQCIKTQDLKDELKIKMIHVPAALPSLVLFSDCTDTVRSLISMILTKTKTKQLLTPEMKEELEDFTLAIDSLLSGALKPLTESMVFDEFKEKVGDARVFSSQNLVELKAEWFKEDDEDESVASPVSEDLKSDVDELGELKTEMDV